jgi:alanyl-tRNA synthetase
MVPCWTSDNAVAARHRDEADRLRAEVEQLKKEAKRRPASAAEGDAEFEVVYEDGTVVVGRVSGLAGGPLRDLTDRVKQQKKAGVVLVGATDDGRAFLVANVDAEFVSRVHAGELIREIAPVIGGGGGGRPTLAEAGGKNPEKLAEALDAGRAAILAKLA